MARNEPVNCWRNEPYHYSTDTGSSSSDSDSESEKEAGATIGEGDGGASSTPPEIPDIFHSSVAKRLTGLPNESLINRLLQLPDRLMQAIQSKLDSLQNNSRGNRSRGMEAKSECDADESGGSLKSAVAGKLTFPVKSPESIHQTWKGNDIGHSEHISAEKLSRSTSETPERSLTGEHTSSETLNRASSDASTVRHSDHSEQNSPETLKRASPETSAESNSDQSEHASPDELNEGVPDTPPRRHSARGQLWFPPAPPDKATGAIPKRRTQHISDSEQSQCTTNPASLPAGASKLDSHACPRKLRRSFSKTPSKNRSGQFSKRPYSASSKDSLLEDEKRAIQSEMSDEEFFTPKTSSRSRLENSQTSPRDDDYDLSFSSSRCRSRLDVSPETPCTPRVLFSCEGKSAAGHGEGVPDKDGASARQAKVVKHRQPKPLSPYSPSVSSTGRPSKIPRRIIHSQPKKSDTTSNLSIPSTFGSSLGTPKEKTSTPRPGTTKPNVHYSSSESVLKGQLFTGKASTPKPCPTSPRSVGRYAGRMTPRNLAKATQKLSGQQVRRMEKRKSQTDRKALRN